MTHYRTHLYFEGRPESPEYRLDKAMKALGLIARLHDRNEAYPDETQRIKHNNAIIERLQKYYSYCVEKLK